MVNATQGVLIERCACAMSASFARACRPLTPLDILSAATCP